MASRATLGRYEILYPLATGGMAELFLANLPGIAGFTKRVVIKRVLPALARDRGFIDMFLDEARLAASLHHQNVVQVQDLGEDANGPFFAMEHLHGADLGELLKARGAALPFAIAVRIASDACAGLHYAHERRGPAGEPLGIVHRDVSPQNLFVTFDGGVKVLDFGIAKAAQQIANSVTRSGTLRGKIPYMSPEQCRGEPLDRRSDVFAVGVVLWEISVGERLYGARGESEFDILKAIVEHDVLRPSIRIAGYPPALETIVLKAMARDREQRYPSCDAMQADLEAYARTTGWWATTRDLANFLREAFSERADASQRLELADIAAEGRVTRPVPEAEPTRPTVASRPSNSAAVAPPDDYPTRVERTEPQRSRTMVRAAIVLGAVGFAALAMTIGYLMRGAPAATPAGVVPAETATANTAAPVGTAPVGTALVGTAPVGTAPVGAMTGSVAPATRGVPAEDSSWFQPDDYLVSKEPLTGGKLESVAVAKMLAAPDGSGKATFLVASGEEWTTAHFWQSHLVRPDELVVGKLAACTYHSSPDWIPPSKADARSATWMIGRITESAGADGKVLIADWPCAVAWVRIVETH